MNCEACSRSLEDQHSNDGRYEGHVMCRRRRTLCDACFDDLVKTLVSEGAGPYLELAKLGIAAEAAGLAGKQRAAMLAIPRGWRVIEGGRK